MYLKIYYEYGAFYVTCYNLANSIIILAKTRIFKYIGFCRKQIIQNYNIYSQTLIGIIETDSSYLTNAFKSNSIRIISACKLLRGDRLILV